MSALLPQGPLPARTAPPDPTTALPVPACNCVSVKALAKCRVCDCVQSIPPPVCMRVDVCVATLDT